MQAPNPARLLKSFTLSECQDGSWILNAQHSLRPYAGPIGAFETQERALQVLRDAMNEPSLTIAELQRAQQAECKAYDQMAMPAQALSAGAGLGYRGY